MAIWPHAHHVSAHRLHDLLLRISSGGSATGVLGLLMLHPNRLAGPMLVQGLEFTIIAVVVSVVAAAPFVPLATWAGRRWRMENAVYYGGLGGLSAALAAFLLVGVPGPPGAFGPIEMVIALAAPVYGTFWGLAWWYLHRRWKSEA